MATTSGKKPKETWEKKKMPKNYDLLKDIRSDKRLYKANWNNRDRASRKLLEQKIGNQSVKAAEIYGQLCLTEYLQPKYEAELEYYDAMPLMLVFGRVKNKDGELRILGWNLHYYPPKMRWQVLNRVFEIYKPYYAKIWNNSKGLSSDLSNLDYHELLNQLQKAKLDFGVRMYIPKLIRRVQVIPVKFWSKAIYTEGRFKKQTRDAIMNYWRQFITKSKGI